MKTMIKNIEIYKAVSNISQNIADATHLISEIGFYVVEITLENGVTGQGYLLSFHYSPNAILGSLKDIKGHVLKHNYHAYETLKLKSDWEKETEYFGIDGIQKWAYATMNVAMWDAWAKTLNTPIWKLLGNYTDKAAVYGSGGWLSYSDEELINEVVGYKERGFKAVKIKVGSDKTGRDIERLKKVRKAVGEDLKIMMDANQGMDVPSAIKLSNDALDIGIHWFEEPVSHTDFSGYEILRRKTNISLSMGEREYNTESLKELIKRNGIDLWQPDIIRIGGVEAWLESAHYAKAHNIPVLPHYYKDYDVPLLCTITNGYGAESFDWIDDIIDEPMTIENGFAYPRNKPGWGFEFKKEFLTKV